MQSQYITLAHLEQLGINLDNENVDALLAHLNETLEERVGLEITESLDDQQLKELVALQEDGSDEEVAAWLEKHVPEMQQITQDEIDILLGELAENSDGINEHQ